MGLKVNGLAFELLDAPPQRLDHLFHENGNCPCNYFFVGHCRSTLELLNPGKRLFHRAGAAVKKVAMFFGVPIGCEGQLNSLQLFALLLAQLGSLGFGLRFLFFSAALFD